MHATVTEEGSLKPHEPTPDPGTEKISETTTTPVPTTTTKKKHDLDRVLKSSKYTKILEDMDDLEPVKPKKDADVYHTTGTVDLNNLTVTDGLICCYSDPLDPKNRIGRPFVKNEFIEKHWTKYSKVVEILIEPEFHLKSMSQFVGRKLKK